MKSSVKLDTLPSMLLFITKCPEILLLCVFFCLQAEHFRSLSKNPVISSLSASEGLDSNSKKSVEVELYCTVCGVEKVRL